MTPPNFKLSDEPLIGRNPATEEQMNSDFLELVKFTKSVIICYGVNPSVVSLINRMAVYLNATARELDKFYNDTK